MCIRDRESTEKGGVRNSIQNCLTVFQHDPELSGAVAKNLLTERIDLLKPIGRKRRTGSKAMTDTDMKYIRLYLEKTYGLTSEKKIADAADLAADANSYHPIRDYLNGLVWDGKERIRYCLRHFLGADTDNFTYHSLRLFLLGAIHRAFCPGCKFEVMLCLVCLLYTSIRLLRLLRLKWADFCLRRHHAENAEKEEAGTVFLPQ